jgi:pimeloyl-ACP methyl ester carboxylesterase
VACRLPSQPGSHWQPGPCAFTIPDGARVQCGWLRVPEDRTKVAGRGIRLHAAIYQSRSEHPAPDPIVWLVGGPGGRGLLFSSKLYSRVVEPYIARRDFIVLDVRGTGYSEPALDCPDPSGNAREWVPACRDRLSTVADLRCYNSAAVAADLADLRRALGYREWNLMGESYGTRLALVAMRDRPEGIRSVILDSVVPPEADQYADGPAKFANALDALFSDCAADLSCRRAYPDLRGVLRRTADQLDRAPRRIEGVWHGRPLVIRFDGRQLLQALHMALYESDLIPQIPRGVYRAADGGADDVWLEVVGRHSIFVRSVVDQGAHFSYHCAEEVPFTDRNRLKAEDERLSWMRHVASGSEIVETCRLWMRKRPQPRENLPVRSRIPVLLLAGQYDPVTPPEYARSAAAHLTNSYVFVFPGMGHQLTANTVSPCPQKLVLQFLDSPNQRPPSNCLDQWRPRWEVQ